MSNKILITAVISAITVLLSIYFQFDKSASLSQSQATEVSGSTHHSQPDSGSNTQITSNPFQNRLDEQRLRPNQLMPPAQMTSSKYPPGHDPFKAFLEAERKQRVEQARQSPFEK